ncbi:MAG: hypothetical protein WCK29_00460 [archaeon]
MVEKYRIFLVTNYEVMYDMGNAAVSGSSREDALSVLEEYLLSPEAKGTFNITKEELQFKVRGEVIDTGINADQRTVIYSKYKKDFSQTKLD